MRPLFCSSAGIRHYWREKAGDDYEVVSFQDCAPVLEANKSAATFNDGYSPSRELRRAASIPLIVILKWLNEEGWFALDPACAGKLKEKLNSSDYRYLRTAPGRL